MNSLNLHFKVPQSKHQVMRHSRLLTKHWGLLDGADEILCHIFEYADGKSLCAIQRTCRVIHGLIHTRDDSYWYTLCRSEWGISPEYLCVNSRQSKHSPLLTLTI